MARKDPGPRQMITTCQSNANHLVETDNHISLILFILPEGVLAYDSCNEQPTNVDRLQLITLHELEDQLWIMDGTVRKLHTVRWGYYTFRLMNIDLYKKILRRRLSQK